MDLERRFWWVAVTELLLYIPTFKNQFSLFYFILFLLQHGEHFLHKKNRHLVYLQYHLQYVTYYTILPSTTIFTPDYNTYTTFYSLVFSVTHLLQFKTGFHLTSSIFLLLYLAAMWRSVSYFLLTISLQEEKKGRLLFLRQFYKCRLPKTIQ